VLHDVVSRNPALSARSEAGGAPEPTEPALKSANRLPTGWALFCGLVGPVVAACCIALEPPPADPNAGEPLFAMVLGLALLVAMCGATTASVRRQYVALSWASVVGGLSMGLTITCPLSGHHVGIGMWWVGQFVISGAAWAAAVIGKHSLEQSWNKPATTLRDP
jgi:hypothetical protein